MFAKGQRSFAKGQRSPSLALDDSPLMIFPSTGPGGRRWRGERGGGKAVAGVRASGESTA